MNRKAGGKRKDRKADRQTDVATQRQTDRQLVLPKSLKISSPGHMYPVNKLPFLL